MVAAKLNTRLDLKRTFRPVAYLRYGGNGTCHGRYFDGGAKIAWQKKIMTYSFLNFYFAPQTNIFCKAASTQRPYLMH